MPNVQVPVVVGSNRAEALICTAIPLPLPALEIVDIRKTVIIDSCKVIPNKVIIDGRLRKNIAFKTLVTGTVPPAPGVITACTGIVNTATGSLNHITVDIAFTSLVRVPGARADDTCEVLQAVVEGENEEPMNVTLAGTFSSLLDKTVLALCVKVVRHAVLAFPDVEEVADVCPPVTTTGVPMEMEQREVFGRTRPGALPGTAIGPTLSFGGPFAPGALRSTGTTGGGGASVTPATGATA